MFRSLTEEAAHRLRLLAITLAAVGLAVAPDLLAGRKDSLLTQAIEIGSCPPEAKYARLIRVDGHTVVARSGNNRLFVYDVAANRSRLLPPVSIRPYWRDPKTSDTSLYDIKAISPNGRFILWKAVSGVARFSLNGGPSKQIITYPAAWLDQWKTKWQYSGGPGGGYPGAPGGGYPGAPGGGYPGSPGMSTPLVVKAAPKAAAPVPEPMTIYSMAWTQDNRHWLSLENRNHGPFLLRLRDFDGNVLSQMRINGQPGMTYLGLLGMVNRDTVLLRVGPISYMTVDIRNGLTVQKTWTLRPPADCDIAMLSPDGTRLLWQGYMDNQAHPWLAQLTYRFNQDRQYPYTQVISMSDLDGGHMREIGREDPASGDYTNLQWLPDSKHAAFTMNDKTWSIAL